jgi:membrane-associated PAP2 superfamily phosphatase
MAPGVDVTPAIPPPSPAAPAPLDGRAEMTRDLVILATGLLGLIAWDALGLDLPISRLFGDATGFALRDQWFISDVLHSGLRYVAWAIALVLVVGIWRPLPFERGLARRERVVLVLSIIACALLIPLLKLASLTSCPWSLAEFGGPATYVSHWRFGQADGGPGHCFPAGHATAAFCFLPGWFILRRVAPVAARRWLIATLVGGMVMLMVQVARGAHYVSHSLWTAWFCCLLGVVLVHALRGREPTGRKMA